VFHQDVAKEDLDVAYVCNGFSSIIQVSCKCFQTYVLSVSAVFRTFVASVLSECCKNRLKVRICFILYFVSACKHRGRPHSAYY